MRFLVGIYRPLGYDSTIEGLEMKHAIDELNNAMVAEGVRVFVGGLHPPQVAKAIRPGPKVDFRVTDGPFVETKEHLGGFWILELPDMDEAIRWGHKAAVACRCAVEVRGFY